MNQKTYNKGLAVYFYPEVNREIVVVGVFKNKGDIASGIEPLKYAIWDENGRLDVYDFEEWNTFPTRDEVKIHYIDLL
jgi:hypothetical protein